MPLPEEESRFRDRNDGTQKGVPLPLEYESLLDSVPAATRGIIRNQVLEALALDTTGKKSPVLIGERRVKTQQWSLIAIDRRVTTEQGSCDCGAPCGPYDQVCPSCGGTKQTYFVRDITFDATTTTEKPDSSSAHPNYKATLTGNGAIAQGTGAMAAGAGGRIYPSRENQANRASGEPVVIELFEVQTATAKEWVEKLESQGYKVGATDSQKAKIINYLTANEDNLRAGEGYSTVVELYITDLGVLPSASYTEVVRAAKAQGLRPLTLGEALTLRIKLGRKHAHSSKYIALERLVPKVLGPYEGSFL